MKTTARKTRWGMTLVEVLAAVMMIAIVLPVAMYGVSIATSLAGQTRRRGEATSLAEAKLNDLLVSGDWQLGGLSGNFDDNPGYSWQAAVSNWDELGTQELDVHVMWTARNMQQEVVLSTVVYTPTGGSAP